MFGNGASGSADFIGVNIDFPVNAGVYYANDMKGTLEVAVSNSVGPAIKFGASNF